MKATIFYAFIMITLFPADNNAFITYTKFGIDEYGQAFHFDITRKTDVFTAVRYLNRHNMKMRRDTKRICYTPVFEACKRQVNNKIVE